MSALRQLRMSPQKMTGVAAGNAGMIAGFATRAARKRIQQAQTMPFTQALSAFMEKITSPDVHPDAATTELNDKSSEKVMNFVKTVAQATNAYPPAMAENVVFMVRDKQTGKPRQVSTLLRTTGGDCSRAVGKSMATLFAGAGSPSLFYWDHGMWQLSNEPAGEAVVQDARSKAAAAGVPSSEPMTLEELEAIQAKMAAKKQHSTTNMGEHFLNQDAHSVIDATFRNVATNTNDVEAGRQTDDNSATSSSSSSISTVSGQTEASDAKPDTEAEAMSNRNAMQELTAGGPEADGNSLAEEQEEQEEQVDIADVKEQIKRLEPLLAALAAVPWIDPGAEDGQRVPFIKSTVLDEVEGMGWDIRGGVSRIWAGDTDLGDLITNKDPGSQLALQTILDFAKKFKADFGKRDVEA